MFSSAQSTSTSNMVAVGTGHSQLTGESKDEYPKWLRLLRIALNNMRVLDTETDDKVRVSMGNTPIAQNYGKSRGVVTQVMLDEDEDGLRSSGFKIGDTILRGTDRREYVKAIELRVRERKHVIATIMLLAKVDSPLYQVLSDASRACKDPNALLEAAELFYNSPCMATLLSIANDERVKLDKLREDHRVSPLQSCRTLKQIGIETTAQFMSVFTTDQIETAEGRLQALELFNFCRQIIDLERNQAILGDTNAMQFINQYVRGHKGSPMDYDRAGFWRDFDAHLVVFHETPKRGSKNGRQNRVDGGKLSSVTQGSSSLTEEEAADLKTMATLKSSKPGTKKWRNARAAACHALGFKTDELTKASDVKERSVCFRMRDTGECIYGSKCRYSHDKAKLKEAKEAKAKVSVFSVPEASKDSDFALMSTARGAKRAKRSQRRVSYQSETDSDDTAGTAGPRMIDWMIEGDAFADLDRGATPTMNMMTATKKLKPEDRA